MTSVGVQTIWSLPVNDIVSNCPMPSGVNDKILTINAATVDSKKDGNPTCDTTSLSRRISEDGQTFSLVGTIANMKPEAKESLSTDQSSPQHEAKPGVPCQVCGDRAAGFHCGCFVCEACKKFFIRTYKQNDSKTLRCSRTMGTKTCEINRETRTLCQGCRYNKCLLVGMKPPGQSLIETTKIKSMKCQVCEANASGYHFGVLSCEGCKAFFRRLLIKKTMNTLRCLRNNKCEINNSSRSFCKACRYQKCLDKGMSPDAKRVGRLPNHKRHQRILQTQQESSVDDSPDSVSHMETDEESQQAPLTTPEIQTGFSHGQSIFPGPSSFTNPLPAPQNVEEAAISSSGAAGGTSAAASGSEVPGCSSNPDISWHKDIEEVTKLYYDAEDALSKVLRLESTETFDHMNDEEFFEEVIVDLNKWLICILKPLKESKGFADLCVEDKLVLTRLGVFRSILQIVGLWFDTPGDHMFFTLRGGSPEALRIERMLPELQVAKFYFKDIRCTFPDLRLDLPEKALLFFLNVINKDNLDLLMDPTATANLYCFYHNLLINYVREKYEDCDERMKTMQSLLKYICDAGKRHGAAVKAMCHTKSIFDSTKGVMTWQEVYKNFPARDAQ